MCWQWATNHFPHLEFLNPEERYDTENKRRKQILNFIEDYEEID